MQRVVIYTAIHCCFSVVLSDPGNIFRAVERSSPTIVVGRPSLYEAMERRFHAAPERRRALLDVLGRLVGVLPGVSVRTAVLRVLFRPSHQMYGGRVRLMLVCSAPTRLATLKLFR